MLTTITASLLIGASTGLLFNVRLVLHLSVAAVAGCAVAALFGAISPAGAALYAICAICALQVGYFVSLIIVALGLTREPAGADDAVSMRKTTKTPSRFAVPRSKRPRV